MHTKSADSTLGFSTQVLSNATSFAPALAAVAAAQQVVLYLGIDGTVEGEGKDRHAIGLPAGQL
jgi:hypothetical protein